MATANKMIEKYKETYLKSNDDKSYLAMIEADCRNFKIIGEMIDKGTFVCAGKRILDMDTLPREFVLDFLESNMKRDNFNIVLKAAGYKV